MNGLDMVTTSVLGALGCDMELFLRYFPAAGTMYDGTQMIDANIPAALQRLKEKIPNAIFGEWCDSMIQCQSDRTLKHTLLPVLEKFSDVRVVQSRLETLLSQPRREAITMMLLVAANIPLLYLLNKDWYDVLMYSTPGQIVLSICAGIVLFAAVRVLKLSKPMEYGR